MPGRRRVHAVNKLPSLGFDLLRWYGPDKDIRTAIASPEIARVHFEHDRLARGEVQFQHQRNRTGRYLFAQTGTHLWFESLVEMRAMKLLDHAFEVAEIASQPFLAQFADGTSHYPDIFVRFRSGHTTVVDVKANETRAEVAASAFDQMRRVCACVGWDYQIFTNPSLEFACNLDLLAEYRKERFRPSDYIAGVIKEAVASGTTIAGALEAVRGTDPRVHIESIYSLIWRRELSLNMKRPITGNTKIWRNDPCETSIPTAKSNWMTELIAS